MRDIEFRTWDKDNREMLFLEEADFIITYTGVAIQSEYGEIKPKDWQLMQCTGLHDKNGKKIFEGDIVKYSSHYCGDYLEKEGIAQVVYCDGQYDLYRGNEYVSDLYTLADSEMVEIIGNIYQHPNLLEDKNKEV